MKAKITSSLIISTYNWPDALELVLESILTQSVFPNEIIIADDGSTIETKNMITFYQSKFQIPLIHVYHEDTGFRLSEIRNKAMKKSTGDYIIQIDGDVILHKYFIEDHLKIAKENYFVRGSRIKMNENLSKKILENKTTKICLFTKGIKNRGNGIRFPFLTKLLFYKKEDKLKMLGCNMAFWRKDVFKINGYDNNLQGWGYEDSELAARLINCNVKKKVMKNMGIVYHIYHKERNTDSANSNYNVLEKTVNSNLKMAKNGINNFLNADNNNTENTNS
ncbi:glycosyltransferase family 2 protein [Flavobacterium sp. LS2P90]|uniref:Glycosyltransferase family 2 protein n=1 Tax=Flavobacterium xylosi TaxID=3230415 RepID=A0ABW6HVB6_9FLAO